MKATKKVRSSSRTGRPAADRRAANTSETVEMQQRIASILPEGSRRKLDNRDAESVMELMGDELPTTTRSSEISTPTTSTPVSRRRRSSSSRPAVPTPVTSPPECSNPSLNNLSPPEFARELVEVVEHLGGAIFTRPLEEEEEEEELLLMEKVVVGESEDVAEGDLSDQDLFDDNFDDEVIDATYQPEAVEVSSEEEEEDASLGLSRRISIAAIGRRSSGREMQPAGSSGKTAPIFSSSTQPPKKAAAATESGTSKSKYTSPIWNFFTLSTVDKRFATCNFCQIRLSRGQKPSNYTTTCLLNHLAKKHQDANDELKKLREAGAGSAHSKTPSHPLPAPAAPAAAGVQMRKDTPLSTPEKNDDLSFSQSSVDSYSSTTGSKRKRQTLLHETYPGVMKAQPPQSRRIRLLNGLLAQAMCSQLLPYSLIQKGSVMQKLLQSAAPEWHIPSRHYFSRTAIPALHRHVKANVERGLDYAVCERVHVTMDSWSSRCGTGRYLSFTAHWVSLVEGGEETAATAAAATKWVVPPRGVRGNAAGSSDPVPSSGTPGTKHVHHSSSSVIPRHCQALLEMVSLGKKKLTAEHVLARLLEQEENWLTKRGLRVGEVVTDNGANLVSAVAKGHLTHIPCLAHVLNLVVQKFLSTYQGMNTVLTTARKVVGHFRHSGGATACLEELQVKYGLPRHRLIQDVTTRWNSSLAMLERLVEQREAVSWYLRDLNLDAMSGNRSNKTVPPMIRTDDWKTMQQVCRVLAPFQQATIFVSRDRSILCEYVPLLHMLDTALYAVLTEGEAALVQQEQLADAESTFGGEELEVGDGDDEGVQPSAASVVRGWTGQEVAEEDDDSGPPISLSRDLVKLFPMAAHMLQCLRKDPRVKQMQQSEDMWISMMLDPRLKGKLGQFLPHAADPVRQMRDLQRTLICRLEEAFPQPYTPPAASVQPEQQQVPASNSSSSRRPTDLISLTKTLYSTVELPREEVPAAASSSNQNQRLTRMVTDYMGSFSGLDSDTPVDPMMYWVKRLEIWSELAQYALQVLSCPPSSVLSERCFSAAGGVVTEKRSRLSTDSVDRLTFLKMNHAWVEGEFLAPVVGERGHELNG